MPADHSLRFAVAVTLLAAPAISLAQVPEPPASIVGSIASTSDTSVVLVTDKGAVTIAMTPGWTLVTAHPVAARDIKPGDFIATANTNIDAANGRSIELRIMEQGYQPENGSHPIGRPNTSMTHGTVVSAAQIDAGELLKVTYPGGARSILVPASVDVTGYDVIARSAAAPGAKVNAITRKGSDGVPRAGRLILIH